MDLQNILQDERKKKFLIIGLIVFFVVIGSILIFSRSSAPSTGTEGEDGQTQLLTDLSQLSPRDGVAQDQNRLIAPIVKVSADVPVVAPGQPSVISWNAANATSCVDGNGNAIRTSGSLSITPQENYTMDVVCTNPKGTTIESITVAVTTTPIITLTASPEEVLKGEQSFISWTTVNTTRCVDAAGKTLRLSGGMPVVPQTPYTFEISCTGPNGTDKKSVTVNIVKEKTTPGVVYVYKWKATPGGPVQTSTFQTNTQCQDARAASTGYDKTACTKVTVSSTTGGTTTTTTGTNTGTGVLACTTPLTQSMASGSTDSASNGEVTMLQNFLHSKGFLASTATGTFGSETSAALKKFQESIGLGATGIVNSETRTKIQKINCDDAGIPTPGDPTPGGDDDGTNTVGEGTPGPKITISHNPKDRIIRRSEVGTITWDIKDADNCTIKVVEGGGVVVAGEKKASFEKGNSRLIPSEFIGFSGSINLKITGTNKNIKLEFLCDGANMSQKDFGEFGLDLSQGNYDAPPEIETLEAKPEAIAEASVGAFSEISWEVSNADKCKVSSDAYLEVHVDSLGLVSASTDSAWKSIKGIPAAVTTSGTARVKPGHATAQEPYHTTTTTSDCSNYGGDGMCSPITTTSQVGDGSRMGSTDSSWLGGGFTASNPPATVTISCEGPLAKPGLPAPGKTSKSVVVSITPTPSSGGGGGW